MPDKVVSNPTAVCLYGLCETRKFGRRPPVEAAAINDYPTHRRPMATDPLQFVVNRASITFAWWALTLLADSVTISAPKSSGLATDPQAPNVLSTTSGMPWRWAISARAGMFGTLDLGFPTLSQNIALVLLSISGSIASGSSPSANLVVIPYRAKSTFSWLCEPP